MRVNIEKLKKKLTINVTDNGCIPFWSWNDKLCEKELERQIEWMAESGAGGFFMHARGGLKTEYLSEEWMKCIETCAKKAEKCGIKAWIYDENGWPSGFAGGKLLENKENRDCYLTADWGEFDAKADASFILTEGRLERVHDGHFDGKHLNVYRHISASTADILNPDVVDKFISLTHDAYEKRLKENFHLISGFFTDEPQYYRWNTPYTVMLEKYFDEKYGEDIFDKIGLLFEEAEGYREFRYRYYLAMQTLMLENFAKKIYNWCASRGMEFTGHYIDENSLAGQMLCCGGIMPFYEFEHMPGIDWLARFIGNELPLRQIASAAAQTDKRRLLTETFGCCGWDITPTEVKAIAEYQFVGGINVMCQHLVPYSEHGQRKRDYPAHYSRINPWVREGDNFRRFNDYFTRLGKLISESDEVINVAVLHPIRSAYIDYKRYVNFFEGGNIESLEQGLRDTMRRLKEADIQYHFVDETMLEAMGKIENGKLVCGNCDYAYLIIPEGITCIGENTDRLLREYVSQDGKLMLLGIPKYIEGIVADFSYLKTNVDFSDLTAAQICTTDRRDTKLHFAVRKLDNSYFVFLQNTESRESVDVTFTLPRAYCSFEQIDLNDFSVKSVPLSLTVEPYGSRVLFFSDEPAEVEKKYLAKQLDEGELEVISASENYLPVDFVRYSVDGINYSEKYNHIGLFNKLLQERYEGKIWLKYEFEVRKLPSNMYLISEGENMTLNGTPVAFTENAWEDISFKRANVTELIKLGTNEAVSQMDYYQSERVYYALFGENVTESLRNCLAYDSEIEPIYLAGDFGVFSDTGITKGEREGVLLGDNFYIGERKTKITELITDGYPFFAGKLRLKGKLTLKNKNVCLELKGRYHSAAVYINGTFAGKLLTSNQLNISSLAMQGENTVEIDTVIGNRNLFGPHHGLGDEEPLGVGPGNFELSGWKDGKSERCLSRYALVSAKLFHD